MYKSSFLQRNERKVNDIEKMMYVSKVGQKEKILSSKVGLKNFLPTTFFDLDEPSSEHFKLFTWIGMSTASGFDRSWFGEPICMTCGSTPSFNASVDLKRFKIVSDNAIQKKKKQVEKKKKRVVQWR